MTGSEQKLVTFLERESRSLGFDEIGITRPQSGQMGKDLAEYCARDYHGSMDWLLDTQERRSDPKKLWPDVRSVIVLAMNYGPSNDPHAVLQKTSKGALSVYAQNRDYHDVIKGKLKTLAAKLLARARELGLSGDVKVFVDTAPLMEKPHAMAAGLGWQGKHTNLVSKNFGSWLFLGSILTTLDLAISNEERESCGSCNSCLTACPTDAFPAPFQIDARRCISYLTIENKGPIPREFRKPMGNRIYGCDDCLSACPWNKFAQNASEIKLTAKADYQDPDLAELLEFDDAAFRQTFAGSPVKRIGRDRFIRNCLIAAGNSRDPDLIQPVNALMDDRSPLVRGAAIWALAQLAPDHLDDHGLSRQNETDRDVIREWQEVEKPVS